jgi:hypothetical protein
MQKGEKATKGVRGVNFGIYREGEKNNILGGGRGGGGIWFLHRYCFALSPRRPYEEYKRMVLEHTHGLFIT